MTLDDIGINHNTDKASECSNGLSAKDYCRHYEQLFHKLRYDKLRILEIGIKNGASLRMWRDYFEYSLIVGMDINPKCHIHHEERITTFIGDAGKKKDLRECLQLLGPFDIVIDDGSHKFNDQQIAFEVLFPKTNHFYAIEDLHVYSDGKVCCQHHQRQAVDEIIYTSGLARKVNVQYMAPSIAILGK